MLIRSAFGGPSVFARDGTEKLQRRTPNNKNAAVTDWNCQVTRIIDRIDQDDLPKALFDAIASVVPFKFASSYVYTGRSKPVYIHDTFVSARAKQGLANYIDSTYVLNPVYNAYLKGVCGGIYRIGDIAPDDYFESGHYQSLKMSISDSEEIGYITNDWPRGMEELVIMIELPASSLGEISLLQPVALGGFSGDDMRTLQGIEPVIAAAFRHFWLRVVRAQDPSSRPDAVIDEAFAEFGRNTLTQREREVTRFILRGHSTRSISLHLGISVTTVKTHRKNLYAKLGIASQFELFSEFLAYLTTEAA